MFLLLAENKVSSSMEIKSLLDENKLSCDLLDCSSLEALLELSEKLFPEIVMIDADFLIDTSDDIISRLHQVSPDTYIISFVDSEQFEKLHLAIDKGIDDYLFKPLQDEDVMLKINLGFQRNRIQDENEIEVQEPVLVDRTLDLVNDEDSNKRFHEIADDFEQQAEKVDIISPSVDELIKEQDDVMVVEPVQADFDNLGAFSDLTDVPAPVETTIEPHISHESSDEEIPVEVEPQGYIEDIDEYSPSDDVLDYYKGQLDNSGPEPETTSQPAKTEEPVINVSELPESELESKVNLQEEKYMQIDDAELFGVDYTRRPVDTKSFEDLFHNEEEGKKKKRLFSPGRMTETGKKDKEEDLFAADEEPEPVKPVLPGEPDAVLLRDEDKLVEMPEPRKKKDKTTRGRGNRFVKIFGNLITIILLIFLITLSFFLIQSRISNGSPEIAGYKVYYVLSESMSPAFETGSVIFVRQINPLAVVEGDIITFNSRNNAESPTTHRIVGINREAGISFITRGDANIVNDPDPVKADQLIGVVTGTVPYIGHLLSFVQTSQGLILLVFVPGLLILLLELRKIFRYVALAKAEKRAVSRANKGAQATKLRRQHIQDTKGNEDVEGEVYEESFP